MTSKSSGDPFIGYINGSWLPQHELKLSVADDGFRFAATAVERLRTYHGQVFQLASHLTRWRQTLETIGIRDTPDDSTIRHLIRELLDRNQQAVSQFGDIGITVAATPGMRETAGPTFLLHLNVIDHRKMASRRVDGQPLVITEVVQPPPASWPRDAKVRCRLHYYLADQFAHQSQPDASGVLLDQDGSITETSIANIAIVKAEKVISPPKERVLGGITQQVIEAIAAELSIEWDHRPISKRELQEADEILLMGTDSGLWFCNQVNEKPISPGKTYAQLASAFARFVEEDCAATQ